MLDVVEAVGEQCERERDHEPDHDRDRRQLEMLNECG